MIYFSWSELSAGIADPEPIVLLFSRIWPVSCTDMVNHLVPVGYSVSSEIAADCGSGVVGLIGLVSPKISLGTFPGSDTVMSLSLRSMSPSLLFWNSVLIYG